VLLLLLSMMLMSMPRDRPRGEFLTRGAALSSQPGAARDYTSAPGEQRRCGEVGALGGVWYGGVGWDAVDAHVSQVCCREPAPATDTPTAAHRTQVLRQLSASLPSPFPPHSRVGSSSQPPPLPQAGEEPVQREAGAAP
jgi:hypothetical protein